MNEKFEPLTAEELEEIARRRAEAKHRAREILETMTDEEDAALHAAALSDQENPPLTEEDWAKMRPSHEVVPQLVAAQLRRERRPRSADRKRQGHARTRS